MRARALALVGAGVLGACGGAAPPQRPAAAAKPKPGLLGPARWTVTTDGGATPVPGEGVDARGAVLWAGRRHRLRDGFLAERVAKEVDELRGGRFVPGLGVFLWSSRRLFRADTFFGTPEPIGAVEVTDVRPWLDGVVVQRRGAVLHWSRGGKLRPLKDALGAAGRVAISDAVATADGRAAVLDVFGHAFVSPDGGRSWIDVFASEGRRFSHLGVTRTDGLELGGGIHLVLERGAKALTPPRRVPYVAPPEPPLGVHEGAEDAVRGGLFLRGDEPTGARILFARDHDVLAISAHTLTDLGSAAWTGLAGDFGGDCRLVALGPMPHAACVHASGAQVLRLGARLGQVELDATFGRAPEAAFLSNGPVLAFPSRCGGAEPGLGDFDPSARRKTYNDVEDWGGPPEPPQEELPAADAPPGDEAPICVRGPSGAWREHVLRGKDVPRLHRFVVGAEGEVVALVWDSDEGGELPEPPERPPPRLRPGRPGPDEEPEGRRALPREPRLAAPPAAKEAAAKDAGAPLAEPASDVRVVRLRRRAIERSGLQPFKAVSQEGDPRSPVVDAEAWLEPSGAVRVWGVPGPESFGKPARPLRVKADGAVEELAIPEGASQLWFGGRFALAYREVPDAAGRFWESTDGGETWVEIDGPPTTSVPFPSSTPACSEVGCALGDGLLRVGWGGGKAAKGEPLETEPQPPSPPAPRRLRLTCTLSGTLPQEAPRPPPKRPPPPPPPPPADPPGKKGAKPPKKPEKVEKPHRDPASPDVVVSLALKGTEAGSSDGKRWRVRVLQPFAPAAQPRELTVSPAPEQFRLDVVPVLEADGGASLLGVAGAQAIALGERAATVFQAEGNRSLAGAVRPRADARRGGEGPILTIDGAGGVGAASGKSFAQLFRLHRLGSPSLHLGLDPAGAAIVVAFLGEEALLAPLDAPRLGVGAPSAIPPFSSLVLASDPRCKAPARGRFVGVIPLDGLSVKEPGGQSHGGGPPHAIVAIGAEVLCLEAVDASLWGGVSLQARFSGAGKGPAAVARRGGVALPATCAVE